MFHTNLQGLLWKRNILFKVYTVHFSSFSFTVYSFEVLLKLKNPQTLIPEIIHDVPQTQALILELELLFSLL